MARFWAVVALAVLARTASAAGAAGTVVPLYTDPSDPSWTHLIFAKTVSDLWRVNAARNSQGASVPLQTCSNVSYRACSRYPPVTCF